MKPTVMTTGPGVIIATATASTNCRSLSQWCSRHHAAVEERHDRESGAEHERAGLGEEDADLREQRPVEPLEAHAGVPAGELRREHRVRAALPSQRGGARTSQTSTPPARKSHAHLGLGHDGDGRDHQVDRPEQPVACRCSSR